MSLRDIMGAAGLTTWPELALVLFFAVFCAIIIYLFVVRSKDAYEHEASLPLEDGLNGGGGPRDEPAEIPENGHA